MQETIMIIHLNEYGNWYRHGHDENEHIPDHQLPKHLHYYTRYELIFDSNLYKEEKKEMAFKQRPDIILSHQIDFDPNVPILYHCQH